jgi:DNA-directed RNA polymerase specialized sigma subunit
MSRKKVNDPVFYNLANSIAKILEKNNGGKKLNKREFTAQQKAQVERMMELEEIFRETINSYKQSDKIYQKFLMFIKIEKGNILTARPYFREDSKTFGEFISPAFKEDDAEKIKKFHINYKFIVFVIENWRGNLPKKAMKAWEEHQQVRQKIIENSMPLAINIAMKFFKATPKNHLGLMDMISSSIAGLCMGVDKWVGPFRTVFRSVCIARMKSNIMDLYNQTSLHYFPSDKKIIYKANLLKNREKIEDSELLLEAINYYLKESGDKRTLTSCELNHILNGSMICSVESQSDEKGFTIYDTYIDEYTCTEKKVAEKDALETVIYVCQKLKLIEQKVIRLKGVDL